MQTCRSTDVQYLQGAYINEKSWVFPPGSSFPQSRHDSSGQIIKDKPLHLLILNWLLHYMTGVSSRLFTHSFKKVIRKMKTNNICFLKVIHWCLLLVSKHAQIVCPRAQPKKNAHVPQGSLQSCRTYHRSRMAASITLFLQHRVNTLNILFVIVCITTCWLISCVFSKPRSTKHSTHTSPARALPTEFWKKKCSTQLIQDT